METVKAPSMALSQYTLSHCWRSHETPVSVFPAIFDRMSERIAPGNASYQTGSAIHNGYAHRSTTPHGYTQSNCIAFPYNFPRAPHNNVNQHGHRQRYTFWHTITLPNTFSITICLYKQGRLFR